MTIIQIDTNDNYTATPCWINLPIPVVGQRSSMYRTLALMLMPALAAIAGFVLPKILW